VISGGKSKLLLVDRSGSWSCWRQENRTLKQRLEKKDKHIQEMMYHTEKIAAGLAEQNNGRTNHGS
jgi:hypothetical protein